MLPKKLRLKREDLQSLLKRRIKPVSSESFGLIISGNSFEHIRVGVIISTKISKKAVERNRVKRILYDAIQPFEEAIKGNDVVFLVRKSVLGKTTEEIKRELEKVLIKKDDNNI